jgi:hypothetical protein
MNFKMKILRLVVPAFFLAFAGGVSAQQLTVGVDGGISWPTGADFNNWHSGFTLASNDFIWVMDNLGVGIRGAYNRWFPRDIDFNQTIWEAIPSLRVRTDFRESPINVFGQGGFGLYITEMKNGFVTGGAVGSEEGPWIGRWGASAGAGISIGSSRYITLDLFPVFNVVLDAFESGKPFTYFTGNAAISLNF